MVLPPADPRFAAKTYQGFFDSQIDRVTRMGMKQIGLLEMAKMLTGRKYRISYAPNAGMPFDNRRGWTRMGDMKREAFRMGGYINNSLDYETDQWYSKMYYQPVVRLKRWFNPELMFAPLQHLMTPVPKGVILRIEHLENMNVFNQINVLAPVVAFRKADIVIDPIAVATIYHGHPSGKNLEQAAHFFIAKWPD